MALKWIRRKQRDLQCVSPLLRHSFRKTFITVKIDTVIQVTGINYR